MTMLYSVNNTLTGTGVTGATNGDALWYAWKEFMKSAGWTVIASCDGTTVNLTSDIITKATSGAGGMSNAHSWFILKAPGVVAGQQVQFLIKSSSNGTDPNSRSGRLIVKSVQGFSLTESWLNLGSITPAQPPICYDPISNVWDGPIKTGCYDPDGSDQYNLCQGSSLVWDYHFAADNAAPYGWWIATGYHQGGSNNGMNGFLAHEPLVSTDPLDPDPYVMMWFMGDNSLTSSTLRIESAAAGSYVSKGWWRWEQSASYAEAAAKWSSSGKHYSCNLQAMRDTSYVPGSLSGHPASNKDPLIPIYWMTAADPRRWCKGQGMNMKWIGKSRLCWDTMSVSGTRDWLVLGTYVNGYVAVPWNGSIPNT